MRAAFRVDASQRIGIGHFMRCLTLADALQRDGGETRFVCRQLGASLRDLLVQKGHEWSMLEGGGEDGGLDELAHASFLGTSQQRDAADTLRALSGPAWDWLIVDHYALDARWESALRNAARRVMVIDDIADRVHDCDVLLDQNLYPDMETRYAGKVPAHCRVLLGPRYAVLRDEFHRLRGPVAPRAQPVKRVFVFLGGADPDNLTERAIEAIHKAGNGALAADVVIGAENPHRSAIERACEQYGYACHVHTPRMAELMAAADLAIGASGSASWERCCLGLASVSVAFADNHLEVARALDRVGASVFVGDQKTASIERIARALGVLMSDQNLRLQMSSKAHSLVDGLGCERVRDVLCGNKGAHATADPLTLRPATLLDSDLLLDWRNDAQTREASHNTAAVRTDEHVGWLSKTLEDPSRRLFVAEEAGCPVGTVRASLSDGVWELSWTVAPNARGRGLAKRMVAKLAQQISEPIRAEVKADNVASARIAEYAGMELDREAAGVLLYRRAALK